MAKRAITEVERLFKDSKGEVRSLTIRTHEHGWDAELDGESIDLGAFHDICALLAATGVRA